MTLLAFMRPETARTVLWVLIGVCYLGYHLAEWWWRKRERQRGWESRRAKDLPRNNAANVSCLPSAPVLSKPQHHIQTPSPESPPHPGEELYAQARVIAHRPIPSFKFDAEYLELLGQSAALDFAPALAKLGDYAMRRGAWVEAYYWMTKAKRSGILNLDNVLRAIRTSWSLDGFPDEVENVTPLFSEEAGSIGRALLSADSGHDASCARAFLKEHHPEYLKPIGGS